MFSKYLFSALVVCLTMAESVDAKMPAAKRAKTYFKLIAASSQRTLPGIPGAPIKTEYYFVIRWEGARYPQAFFWRGESGWASCDIKRAHRLDTKSEEQPDVQYKTEQADMADIHKGDTLVLTPLQGGKFPVPAGIPESAKNTLFFKTAGSKWLSFPVKNIIRKRDKAMP